MINQKPELYLKILLAKEKKIIKELHDSVDYNNLNFEYGSKTENVSFYNICTNMG